MGAIDRYRGYTHRSIRRLPTSSRRQPFVLGNSLLQNDVEFLGNDGQPVREGVELSDAFFNPGLVLEQGIDGLLKYAAIGSVG